MSDRPSWTLSEAVERMEVSRSTLRRRLEAGAFPNAAQDPGGAWRVPLPDLLAAGFRARSTWKNDTLTELAQPEDDLAHDHAHELQTRINTLEQDLLIERAHRQAAERVAEAERNRAETALMALRMLEPPGTARPAPGRRQWFWMPH